MPDHPAIEVQLDRFLNRMDLAAFVTRLLQHPKDAIVAFHMIICPVHVFPAQIHDHLVKLLFADLFQRSSQKGVGLISGMVDHTGAAITRTLLGDVSFKKPIKLLVESTKEFQLRCNREHQSEIGLVLLTEFLFFTHDEILMLPDERRLFLFAHATSPLTLLLSFLAGSTPTLLAAFIALAS